MRQLYTLMSSLIINKVEWRRWLPVVVAVAVACVLLLGFPYVMVTREQSLLFLWNGDYFVERIVLPGGLAQYLGELLTQFFGNPIVAAIIYGVLCLLAQRLMLRLVPRYYWLSYVPVAVIFLLAFDTYIPLTLTVSLLLTMGIMAMLPGEGRWRLFCTAILIPIGYWLLGPAIVLMPLCCIRWSPLLAVLLAACVIGSSWVAPYPLRQIARGIDYYWEEEHPNTIEEMECDMLVRQKKWNSLVSKFSNSASPAIQNARALAMFQTGRIGEGELKERLNLSGSVLRTQSSAFIMSEVYLLMGMVQLSQRCAFEAMESVPNHNKSGRALRRLVETNLVCGHTAVALKYIAVLEETYAYHGFAARHRPLAEHPELMDRHPYFNPLREVYEKSRDTFFH